MKKFKQLTEELFNECSDYGADNMTIKELKIARNAAENILEMIEDGVSVQRWQISAIVKASEELASVCASMRAEEEDYDNGWEDEEEPIYVGFEYPSMYGESVGGLYKNATEWENAAKSRGLVVKSMTHPSGEMTKYQIAKDKEGNNRGHFDHATKSGHLKEEADLDESYTELSNLKSRIARSEKKIKSLPDLHPEKKRLTISVQKDKKKHDELFKKQFKEDTELSEAPLLGPQGAIHRAASADQSDREYAAQRSFKNAWKAKNPGKQWPGYEKAGFKSPYDFKEETDFEVDVEGLPKMYVKANNPSEVKTNLRKVVKNPEMIRGIERVAKASLQKIFRDKAMGKDEVSEEVELDEVSKDTLHSYLKKASKSVDSLSNERDKVQKDMSKTYSAIAKRSGAENAAHNATTQSQHNKATATYRSATKGANKALGGHGDLVKQHTNLTKKINKRMDGMDRAYDKIHAEEVEQIDELSKKTLTSYKDKATTQLDKDFQDARKGLKGLPNRVVSNRFDGVDRARQKLNKEEVEINEASDLRITKVYNKWPKKATYAVHTPDRKYFKEFDSVEAAEAHRKEKNTK